MMSEDTIVFDTLPTTIGIIGSRSFEDSEVGRKRLRKHVETLTNCLKDGTLVVSGGARGIDRYAEQAARARGWTPRLFLPSKDRPIPQSLFERNERLVEFIKAHKGVIIAFVDVDNCRGTNHTLTYADKHDVPRLVYEFRLHPYRWLEMKYSAGFGSYLERREK